MQMQEATQSPTPAAGTAEGSLGLVCGTDGIDKNKRMAGLNISDKIIWVKG